MTTTATHIETVDMDRPGIPLSRLIKVELRKSVDTRSGFWLLMTIAIITVIANVIFLIAAHDNDRTFSNFLAASGTPQGFLLPILGILLVTSEWSQRTAMVTFSLAPRRSRTVLAKIIAAVILGTLVFAVALVIGTIMTALSGGPDAWNVSAGVLGQFYLGQLIGVLQGVAFGLVILVSAAAIVASFAIPIIFGFIGGLWSASQKVINWIDLGTASGNLFSNDIMTGKQWSQLLVSGIIWLVAPLAFGVWRLIHTEVK